MCHLVAREPARRATLRVTPEQQLDSDVVWRLRNRRTKVTAHDTRVGEELRTSFLERLDRPIQIAKREAEVLQSVLRPGPGSP